MYVMSRVQNQMRAFVARKSISCTSAYSYARAKFSKGRRIAVVLRVIVDHRRIARELDVRFKVAQEWRDHCSHLRLELDEQGFPCCVYCS